MSGRIILPAWVATLGGTAVTFVGILIGVATAAWQARALVEDQTAAISSLRQTIDETVRPTIAKVSDHEIRIGVHDTRIAVIERACCGETLRALSTSTAGATP